MNIFKSLGNALLPAFLFLTLNTNGQSNTGPIIPHEKIIPLFSSYSPKRLAMALSKDETSNAQKALNIYYWMANNIRYDVKEYRKLKPNNYTITQTLFRKKGVCYEYAKLFSILCQNAGIPAMEIWGYSRVTNYYEDAIFYEHDHAWNAIKLDSNWYFVDATWGSGHLVQRKRRWRELAFKWFKIPYLNDRFRFKRDPSFEYFMVAPEKMISLHLPVDPTWQLLEYPVSIKSFEDNKWQGYTNAIDSIYGIRVAHKEYTTRLNKYASLSPIQYVEQMAIKSNAFNPINFKLLAYSNNLMGNSFQRSLGKPDQQISDKTTAMGYYRTAVRYGLNHQKTAAAQSIKMIKKVNDRIEATLIKPITKRYNNSLSYYKRVRELVAAEKANKIRLNNEVVKIGNEENKLVFDPLEPGATTAKSQPEKLSQNKLKISEELLWIYKNTDSLKLLKKLLNNLYEQKELLKSHILDQNMDLNKTITVSTKSVINIEFIRKLELIHEKVAEMGDTVDTMIKKLLVIEKEIDAKSAVIGQLNSAVLAKSKSIQKMIVQNCQLTNGMECDGGNYKKSTDRIYGVFDEKYALANQNITVAMNDNKFNRSLSFKIYKQLEVLKIHLSFVQLYQKSRIGFILLAKNRSDYVTQKIINNSNQNLAIIPFEINNLNRKRK